MSIRYSGLASYVAGLRPFAHFGGNILVEAIFNTDPMTIRNTILWTLFVITAAGFSILLAFASEGIALQHGFMNGTPGLLIALRMVPPDSVHAFDVMGKQMNIRLAVDAPCWFLIICGTAVLVNWRRRRKD